MITVHFPRFIYMDEVSSTNEYAMSLSSNTDPKQNLCLYTYNQTAGRGQIGRNWYSSKGENLTCTFIWQDISLPAKEQFRINIAFTLAIHQLVQSQLESISTPKISIKWPNDIYIGDKKIAGILIQNVLKGDKISTCLLGIGMNINSQSFPADLPNPISLSQVVGDSLALSPLLQQLGAMLGLFLSNSQTYPERQRSLYENLLYRRNQFSEYEEADMRFQGKILGVTEAGKLRMSVGDEERQFNFRELKYVI